MPLKGPEYSKRLADVSVCFFCVRISSIMLSESESRLPGQSLLSSPGLAALQF